MSRRSGRSRLTLVLLALTSITLITLDFRGPDGAVGALRALAADVLSPVRDVTGTVLEPVGDALSGITGYGALEDENDDLRRRLEELEGQQMRNDDAEQELDALLESRGLTRFTDLASVSARVVGSPISNFEQTVRLDRGSYDGIDEDMPVVTGAGLVGRVVEVSQTRSTVRLITDPQSSVGVRLSRSGDLGLVEGVGPDRPLVLGLIEPGTDVGRRELLVTSGVDDSIFPGGIPVGRVTGAEGNDGELEQEVALVPVADLDRLRFVEVLVTGMT